VDYVQIWQCITASCHGQTTETPLLKNEPKWRPRLLRLRTAHFFPLAMTLDVNDAGWMESYNSGALTLTWSELWGREAIDLATCTNPSCSAAKSASSSQAISGANKDWQRREMRHATIQHLEYYLSGRLGTLATAVSVSSAEAKDSQEYLGHRQADRRHKHPRSCRGVRVFRTVLANSELTLGVRK